MAPRKYGDQVMHEVKGGINFQPQMLHLLWYKRLISLVNHVDGWSLASD